MTEMNLRNSQKYHGCSVTIDLGDSGKKLNSPWIFQTKMAHMESPQLLPMALTKTEGSVLIAVMEKWFPFQNTEPKLSTRYHSCLSGVPHGHWPMLRDNVT